jgi:hypothetical protein
MTTLTGESLFPRIARPQPPLARRVAGQWRLVRTAVQTARAYEKAGTAASRQAVLDRFQADLRG